ncbi:MAG: diacylglycerol kinase family protein [Planctomycetaceae bacterium]
MTKRTWAARFRDAGRGIVLAACEQPSFKVHLFVATLVVVFGVGLHVTISEWCLLVLSMASVLAAETVNSSIEILAKVVFPQHHDDVGRSLDMAAGAVLLTAVGAAVVGLIIFVPRLMVMARSLS